MPITIYERHRWDLTPAEAIALQRALAPQIDTSTPLPLDELRLVGGIDVSVKDNISQAAIVVLTYPALDVIERVTASLPTPFPYIPGLLSFREGAVIVDALRQLEHTPDVFIVDGQGIAHPRHIGIAAHIGLWIDVPTVGCGKTRLTGTYEPVPPEKGAWTPLIHHGAVIGAALRTRANVKPVFVSVGNHATLDTACELVLRCTTRYRLPEPIRAAHEAAKIS